ncbi:hypothetical protein Pcinc_023149 [Petrolisthes cinctipes]|uniref:Translation initiation factor eIF2B subunit epsilon n=1 Tax=Petrolisthes cinctipes TaxID=88211 RepID=A0AAE1KG43_PETCI|nr:hypothetical protein Pcinc_023149 [Petrolisthes cinctipes]
MAPKVEVHEEPSVLQAVVLTECDIDYGAAITHYNPKVLVPLANTPLLDYTLAWLERCGVDEVIVYCRANPHTDKIKQHCKRFTSRREECGIKVMVVVSEDCLNLGDAMRDLYSKSLLKDDFILLQGDLVATLNLQDIVAKHKENRLSDKSMIMTCVYVNKPLETTAVEGEEGRGKEVTATLVTAADTGKLLLHRRSRNKSSKISIPTELFQASSDLLTYPAAYDPSLAICSEVVPSLFSDNFDYGSRDSLLRGVIEQEELLGYSIRCQVVQEGYACRASTLQQYQRVSGEVMRREAYPMVCESSLTSHRIRYTYDPFTTTYWEPSAKFTKGNGGASEAVVGAGTEVDAGSVIITCNFRGNGGASEAVVGAGTEVDAGAILTASVVGDHCTLADGVIANAAFIMNNVQIKSGCELSHCYIGDDVVLEKGVVVSSGCVVGPGVRLGPDVTIPPGTQLVAHPPHHHAPSTHPHDDFDETARVKEADPSICGSKGKAFILLPEESDQDDDEEEEESSDDGRSSGPDEGDSEDALMMMSDDEHSENEFRREVQESLTNGMRKKSAAENMVLEINASRHAYNVSMEDVLTTVTQGILRAGQTQKQDGSTEPTWPGINTALKCFADVLRNYVRKGRDQLLVLNAIEKLMVDSPEYLPATQKILFNLNQTFEILEGEVIIHWYKKGGAGTTAFTTIKTSIAQFIEWLEKDSEDEDDDDDSDDESS